MSAFRPKRTSATSVHMPFSGRKADPQCRRCSCADSTVYWYGVQFISYHKSMNAIDWNEKVKEALDRTEFMAISTIDAGGSWTCPVQFGHSLVIAKDSTCTFDRCLIRGTCDIYSRITASPLPFSKLTVF